MENEVKYCEVKAYRRKIVKKSSNPPEFLTIKVPNFAGLKNNKLRTRVDNMRLNYSGYQRASLFDRDIPRTILSLEVEILN